MDRARLIRESRQRAGLTQAALARMTGVGQPNIAAIEAGRRAVSDALFARLLAAIKPRPSGAVAAVRDELVELMTSRGVRSVRLVGSAARGDDEPGSDVDLLVDFGDMDLFSRYSLWADVEGLLGRKVDLIDARAPLRPSTRVRLESEAVPL